MSDKERPSLEELRLSLAEKRLSLRDNIVTMERFAEGRIVETIDQVQNQILNASENIGRTMTRPFEIVQEKIAMGPECLREKPLQTMALTTCLGMSIGLLLGQRQKRKRRLHLSVSPRAALGSEKILLYSPPAPAPAMARGFLATMAFDLVQQIVMNSVHNFVRQRENRSASRP